jgi:hypothetical protein
MRAPESLKDIGNDAERAIVKLAEASCSTNAELEPHRAEIDKARAAWGKKLGMNDADWVDAVAFAQASESGHSFKTDYSTKTLATFTPIDQYWAIEHGWQANGTEISDPIYTADALDAQFTEVGRLAFLEYCVKSEAVEKDRDVVKWALCQADIDKFDPAKFSDQLRSDTAHDGGVKSYLRVAAYRLPKQLKEVSDLKAALIKKDAEYKKLFDIATKARDEWAKGVGTNKQLLDLVSAMDSGAFFQSRKLFEGCEAKTEAALTTAVATIPAKAYTGMHDVRDSPNEGFAHKVSPLLAKTPAVNLSAIAYVACHPKTATGIFLAGAIAETPGFRGPRDAAFAAIMGSTFKFDDMNKQGLDFPDVKSRPYWGRGDESSAGGVVKSVKAQKDKLIVALEKTTMTIEDCVQEHRGGYSRIRSDGTLEREIICDKTGMVTIDTTWQDFQINVAYQKWLKPGVVFTSTNSGPDGLSQTGDVIAIWPAKGAKLPTMVLGATVK